MHHYFPFSPSDIKKMKEVIGIEDVFAHIPEDLKLQKELDLPTAMSELEIINYFLELSRLNQPLKLFRGAGFYDHFAPWVISTLSSRQEFLTAYTPYQPEVSQGTLHYIFEFQSMICELTKMDVANASMYDGMSATAEAMFVATSHTKRNKIAVSKGLNPKTIEVLQTYAKFRNVEIVLIPLLDGATDLDHFTKIFDNTFAGLILASPNYFGIIEDGEAFCQVVHNSSALMIANVNPATLGILKPPGEYGCDIVVGEGQSLGLPLSFGGPHLGFLASKSSLIRKLPGRIVGMTNDEHGNPGFVLTFQAREQHIRRQKANSNICSNQSLMALMATIYLSLLGPKGLKEVALRGYQGAHYLYDGLLKTNKFFKVYDHQFFDEFVVSTSLDIDKINQVLKDHHILGGLPLGDNRLLFWVGEKHSKDDLDQLIAILGGIDHV